MLIQAYFHGYFKRKGRLQVLYVFSISTKHTDTRLTLRLAIYSAKIQRTFMLTYVLFMVVIQCSFPQFADGLGNSMQSWGLLQRLLYLEIVEKLNLSKIRRGGYCWNFKKH